MLRQPAQRDHCRPQRGRSPPQLRSRRPGSRSRAHLPFLAADDTKSAPRNIQQVAVSFADHDIPSHLYTNQRPVFDTARASIPAKLDASESDRAHGRRSGPHAAAKAVRARAGGRASAVGSSVQRSRPQRPRLCTLVRALRVEPDKAARSTCRATSGPPTARPGRLGGGLQG